MVAYLRLNLALSAGTLLFLTQTCFNPDIHQLPKEHTTHATIIGVEHCSDTYPSHPVRFSFLWTSKPVAT